MIVTVMFPCGQRGCDHTEPVTATTTPSDGKVDGGYEIRLLLTAEAKDDLTRRMAAHLGSEECAGYHFIERDGRNVLRLPMMGVEIPLGPR